MPRGMLRWQADGFVTVPERLHKADGEAGGYRPVMQGHTCRGAHSGGGVVAREAESLPGEAVDMCGAIVRPAVAAQIPVAEVVGENEQNVRVFQLWGRPSRQQTECRCRETAFEKVASRNRVGHK